MLREAEIGGKRSSRFDLRRNFSSINLDLDLLERFNDYFGKLCHDEGYTQPIDVQISTKGLCT